ncbi:MAG: CARDB domain-containing protein [Oscillospiraceae bacterium]|jgi:hypothetical protein
MKTGKKKAVYLFLAAVWSLLCVFGAQVPAAANTDDIPDPRVTSATVTPSEPGVGSPFDVHLTFTQTMDGFDFNPDSDYIEIEVTSASNSIKVGHKKFLAENVDVDENDYDVTTLSYDLYIPQKYLKRIGSNYGILKLEITYYDSSDDILESDDHDLKFTVEYLVFSKLDSASDNDTDGRLTVTSFQVDHTPVEEGENFDLTLTVKNIGGVSCTNIISVLDLSAAGGVSINGESDTKPIGVLDAGKTTTVTYPLSCLDKMETNSYPIGITLSADNVSPATSKIYLPIQGTKTGEDDTGEVGDSKPQLIISSYDFGGQAVTGGKEFNLVMNVLNTGSIPIENCKMTVGSETGDSDSNTPVGSIFTPSQSSNTFFISKLDAGATVKKEIALLPKADASPNSYGVRVDFSYDAILDGKRQTLSSQEIITIPLVQLIRFEVGEPVLSNPIFMGEDGRISVDFVNKGKSKVYNVTAQLDGNFDTDEGSLYIGNLDSGMSDTFQANLTPLQEGTLSGTVTFSYEDASGKVLEVVKEFSAEVQAAEIPDMMDPEFMNPEGDMPADEQPNGGGLGWKLWIGIICGVVVVIFATVIVLKKRKAKKLRLLEEEDDYDDEPGGGI